MVFFPGRGCGALGFISQTGERWFGHGTMEVFKCEQGR